MDSLCEVSVCASGTGNLYGSFQNGEKDRRLEMLGIKETQVDI